MNGKGTVFEWLNVEALSFDKTNPRIAKWIEMYGGDITAEQMSLALGAGESQTEEGSATFSTLREAIRTNKGIIHPIIVNREANAKLTVIEGNTRLLIYREFRIHDKTGSWDLIPAMVYDGLSQADIDAIRLQTHLVGPRPWDPYSKAKYLDHLRNSEHLTWNQIVDFCGGRKREAMNYVEAYGDMENHYRPLLESDQDFDASRFSAFVELQNPRITTALLQAKFGKEHFAKWVIDGKFSPLQTVRQLPQILQNSRSREVFLRDGAEEAIKLFNVQTPDASLNEATLEQLAQAITRRILGMNYAELLRLKESIGGQENEAIVQARDHLIQLCRDIAEQE